MCADSGPIEAFRLIEQGSFQWLIKYCWPGITEKDIPHCNTLHAEILHRAHLAEDKVQEKLKVQVITTVNRCISCKSLLAPSMQGFVYF